MKCIEQKYKRVIVGNDETAGPQGAGDRAINKVIQLMHKKTSKIDTGKNDEQTDGCFVNVHVLLM